MIDDDRGDEPDSLSSFKTEMENNGKKSQNQCCVCTDLSQRKAVVWTEERSYHA